MINGDTPDKNEQIIWIISHHIFVIGTCVKNFKYINNDDAPSPKKI